MKLDYLEKGGGISLKLNGELDHHAAREVLTQVGELVDGRRPDGFTLDMSGVSFMDSSGIAVILGTYRRMQEIQGDFSVVGVSAQARRVLAAAGIDRLLSI